jgi:hypothetical protein
MGRRINIIIATVLLIFAITGILLFSENSVVQIGNGVHINTQSLSILTLALLSICIFYYSNKTKLTEYLGELFYNWIFYGGLVAFIFLLFITETILIFGGSVILNTPPYTVIFNTPLYMGALAVGLFLTSGVINQKVCEIPVECPAGDTPVECSIAETPAECPAGDTPVECSIAETSNLRVWHSNPSNIFYYYHR